MEIRHYLEILNHRKAVVLLTLICAVTVAAAGSYRAVPIYTATTLIRIAQPASSVLEYAGSAYGDRLIQTYIQVVKSRPFLEEAAQRLDLGRQTQELAGAVRVEAIANTELMRVSVESSDPQQAAALADMLGILLMEQGQSIYTGGGDDVRTILRDQLAAADKQLAEDRTGLARLAGFTPEPPEASSLAARIRAEEQTYSMLLSEYEKARLEAAVRANSITIVDPATVPAVPSRPNIKLNLVLAGGTGLVGGMALAFVLEYLTPIIHSAEETALLTGLRLQGRIPRLKGGRRVRQGNIPLATDSNGSPGMEAFYTAGANLLANLSDTGSRTVLISSAEPGAGKSTVTANLGIALAQAGRRVIVVDGDLWHPCLHLIFHLPNSLGLANVMIDHDAARNCLRATGYPGLSLLTAGSPGTDTSRLRHTGALADIVAQVGDQAEVVLWDTPPVLSTVDALMLAPLMGLVMLVVAEDRTTHKQLTQAITEIRQTGQGSLGIIQNRSKDAGSYYHYRRAAKRVARAAGNGLGAPVAKGHPERAGALSKRPA